MVEPLRSGDPRRIGPYRLEGRLGAGGMGQVFLGTSQAGRKVAVKLILPELANTPQFRDRFKREVDAARQVGGFHTAQVVDADPDAASPWLVTAFIPGPTLQRTVTERGPLAPDAVLRLGAGLAEGLAAIHRCGLVHRDLKPGNVIMAEDGPRIIDFGVAHTPGDTMTRTGSVIGTYAYMSPEQIRAEAVSPASDVFALGSVLAFAATGRSPFDATSVPAIVHRVTSGDPVLDGLPGELDELVAACLAKAPADRPSTEDVLRRLSVTGPGTAPATAPVVPAKPAKSPTRRSVLFGGVAAATAAVAVPAYFFLRPESWASSGDGPGGGPGNGSGESKDPTQPVARLTGHTSQVECLAFSPNGRTLASGDFNGSVRLWDVATRDAITTFKGQGHTGWVMSLAFSRDGQTLFSGGFDKTLKGWDVRSGMPRDIASYDAQFDSVGCLALSPDGTTLAVGVGSRVELMDPSTGRRTVTFTGHTGSMRGVAFSPDGKSVVSVAADTRVNSAVQLWDAGTGSGIKAFTVTDGKTFSSVTFSPDGRTVAAGGSGVHLWDAATGNPVATLTDAHPYLESAVYRPDKAVIAGAGGVREPNVQDGTGKTVSLWDVATRQVTTTLKATMPESRRDTSISKLAFSPDGKLLAAAVNQVGASDEKAASIQLWKLP
ncbi:WD40 repeat domain-containing serine/threonine protein kinase [Streptomyces sp. UNOB3_S3]|uniref:WD40 repeat domain-containing serine/threonine protein kinase n=1 Tax=Streptomyces sp. UNOB3_S3 TaxID=2871682 RepID=UPI001E36E2E8|nr:serine/threonine-protein kinase [Streptomyces sp. UNOB3_S3]MCC3776871.1 serine/threonine protein kinase [Streptomyces sp. UNOB3_S3]